MSAFLHLAGTIPPEEEVEQNLKSVQISNFSYVYVTIISFSVPLSTLVLIGTEETVATSVELYSGDCTSLFLVHFYENKYKKRFDEIHTEP